jgi:hypothetical protein
MDFNKIIELLYDLEDSSFFEGDSEEEDHLGRLIQNFLTSTRCQFEMMSLAVEKEPLFSQEEIMALKVLANSILQKTNNNPPEAESVVPAKKSAIKKRGRPSKEKPQEEAKPLSFAKKEPEDDGYIDSSFPLTDPKTGLQQFDPETRKPLFLRIKKDASQIKPKGYQAISKEELERISQAKAMAEAASNTQNFGKKLTRMTESSLTSNTDQGMAAALRHALK